MTEINNLSLDEKIRLVTGVGSWKTYDANGKLSAVTMSDGPHGLRKQEEENYADLNHSNIATCFPTGSAIASSFDTGCAKKLATALAAEAKAEKVSVVLGPAINIKRSPLCGRNFEYYSEDPYLAGEMATAYVESMEKEGVGTSLKHFAANSQENHRMTQDSLVDKRALEEIYLAAFRKCIISAKPSTVMASYNKINGSYSCANNDLLIKHLRNEWKYDGLVVSDWGAAIGIVDCIKNGLDLEMPDSVGTHTQELKEAISAGILTEEELDRAVKNVIKLSECYPTPNKSIPADYEAHHKLATELATQCAVLLKHSDVLPLNKSDKVLIIGDMAINMRFQGGGSSHITTLPCKNVVDALRGKGFNIEYSNVVPDSVKAYNKVLYFGGLTDSFESEGYDRDSLNIPLHQSQDLKQLINLCKDANISSPAFITFGGAPFIIPHFDDLSDVLHMHLCGQGVGEACAALISGEENPSGKLSETWPLSLQDTPCYGYYSNNSDIIPYVESLFVGYRYYESFNIPVQFPFGYGLSYTTFNYSDLSVTSIDQDKYNITYNITNTGNYAGSEVSQLYIINPRGDIIRPKIELKGFSKDYISPGETKNITLELNSSAFMIYDPHNEKWIIPEGIYKVGIGSDIRHIHMTEELLIYGEKPCWDDREIANEYFADKPNFNTDTFKKIYQYPYPVTDSNRIYTKADSLETICKTFSLGRLLLKLVIFLVPKFTKTPPDDPATKMVIAGALEAPLESLPALSGGAFKTSYINYLVNKANKKHYHSKE